MNPIMDKNIGQDEIYKILDKRARQTKLTIVALVYTLTIIATLVFVGIFYTKNNDNSPFSKFINTIMESENKEKNTEFANLVASAFEKATKGVNNNNFTPLNENKSSDGVQLGDTFVLKDRTSEKIADSIASVLLSLSLMIFIGFVMKAILVFVRYYMQLGTDFENQKIAYILSKGQEESFKNILINLRENNINFEKTPNLPQEKILLSMLDVLKSNKKIATENDKG